MNPENELSWAAGFVDGDGSILVGEDRPGVFGLKLNATNRHYPSLDRLAQLFGGQVRFLTQRGFHIGWWQLTGHKAQAAIRKLSPYLFTKQRQARIALLMPIASRGGRADRMGSWSHLAQRLAYLEMGRLNATASDLSAVSRSR